VPHGHISAEKIVQRLSALLATPQPKGIRIAGTGGQTNKRLGGFQPTQLIRHSAPPPQLGFQALTVDCFSACWSGDLSQFQFHSPGGDTETTAYSLWNRVAVSLAERWSRSPASVLEPVVLMLNVVRQHSSIVAVCDCESR